MQMCDFEKGGLAAYRLGYSDAQLMLLVILIQVDTSAGESSTPQTF